MARWSSESIAGTLLTDYYRLSPALGISDQLKVLILTILVNCCLPPWLGRFKTKYYSVLSTLGVWVVITVTTTGPGRQSQSPLA
jgi:hypothetical protein